MEVKEYYVKYSLIIIVLFLGIILFIQFTPYLSGILGALTIYILVRKQMFYLTDKKKLRSSLASILILGEAILCFLVPISLAVWLLVGEVQNWHLDPNAFISSIQHIGDLVQQKTGYDVLSKNNITSLTAYLPRLGQSLLGSVGSFAINSFVLLFVLYFMLIGGRKMEAYIYELLPFSENNKKDVLKEVYVMVQSNAIGIPLLAIIQGATALVGYFIFGAPNPVLFGFLTCFATIIPIVGTSLIWFPLAAYLALTGDWFNAIGLAVYGLLVIGNMDNLARFLLQKKMSNTHPLITVFGVVIGLSLFGFWGVVFGPLFLSLFLLCLNMFKIEYLNDKI